MFDLSKEIETISSREYLPRDDQVLTAIRRPAARRWYIHQRTGHDGAGHRHRRELDDAGATSEHLTSAG
jgi:hypothetical protein